MIDKYLDLKSIDPIYWGKSGWVFLNSIALTYKPEQKYYYKLFIEQLPFILPCKTCGENLRKNLPTLDDALLSKETFLNWLLQIRNYIAIENNRPQNKKNLKETIDEIFYLEANYYMYIWLIVLIIIFIFLIILFRNFFNY